MDVLPEAIRAYLACVPAEVGEQRATIALQGLVNVMRPIRIIDGVVREDTLEAVRAAIALVGEDRLIEMLRKKLEERFPDAYAGKSLESEIATAAVDVTDKVVETAKSRRKRRS